MTQAVGIAIGEAIRHSNNYAIQDIDLRLDTSCSNDQLLSEGARQARKQQRLATGPGPQPSSLAPSAGGATPQGRWEMEATESITYKGALMVTKDFVPALGCAEDILASAATMGLTKASTIVAECRRWLNSFLSGEPNPHRLTKDELMALGLYTYDLG
jgi:hypothetical protein